MEQRSTSLDSLPANNSSNTLVNDILREMNDGNGQTQQDTFANQDNVVQNDQTFQRQVDTQAQNVETMQPTQEQLAELHNQESQQNVQEQVQEIQPQEDVEVPDSQNAYPPSIAHGLMPGLSAQKSQGFDIIQFIKTILLFMILYILFSLPDVHKILCKLPFLCKPVIGEGAASLNFIGIVICALLGGGIFATVQTFV